MDQIKIGRFIAEARKERGLTQKELADLLLISDKTVSKWECGNGLPEVSLMLPLCKELGVTVNELLSGKRLNTSEYKSNAEENIINLMKERQENKFKLILEVFVVFITFLGAIPLIMVASYLDLKTSIKALLIAIAVVVMFGGIFVAGALEMTAGAFECSKCGERFVPTKTAYIMGVHTIMRRHLKCPKCGKRNWCRRTLTLKKEEKED